jgi:hypothetical protein
MNLSSNSLPTVDQLANVLKVDKSNIIAAYSSGSQLYGTATNESGKGME